MTFVSQLLLSTLSFYTATTSPSPPPLLRRAVIADYLVQWLVRLHQKIYIGVILAVEVDRALALRPEMLILQILGAVRIPGMPRFNAFPRRVDVIGR